MPEEVLKNIYRLPIPLPGNPLKELNSYLIKGKDRNLLIDTGFRQPACREALLSQMAELGLQPGDADVLVTHRHSDHAGLADVAAGDQGTIYISRLDQSAFYDEASWTKSWDERTVSFAQEGFPPELIAHLADTNPAFSMAPPRGLPSTPLDDGDVLELGGCRLHCLLMPGHTPGQMCFWMEEQGVMFLGDHVLFDITPNITAWQDLPDTLGVYLESLKKIRQYDVAHPLPGHRASGNLKSRVDALLLHHRQRLDEALNAVRTHPGLPAYQIAGLMTWKIRSKTNTWEDFPLAQKWFAVGECMSHLDRLIAEGAIRREVQDGIAHYFCT